MLSATPRFSVVVNTLNRCSLLANALSGLARVEYPSFEVIVVNGPSTDGTDAVLEKWRGKLKVGACPAANLSASRNIGIGLAAGDVIAFLDDDAVPHPYWLKQLAEKYVEPGTGGVGGHTVGRLGMAFQARTTLCDRFGDAVNVSDFFDVQPLCKPGTWLFPSLLGTNASFLRKALEDIGGFDETFEYYLDETDVCLRLVDNGWAIRYAPDALVWHQFAASALRTGDGALTSAKKLVTSHAYFISRHGGAALSPANLGDVIRRLDQLKRRWIGTAQQDRREGRIDEVTEANLTREVTAGLDHGVRLAAERVNKDRGDLQDLEKAPFLAMPSLAPQQLRVCLVSRELPPESENGIAVWTDRLSKALAARGHTVHVLTAAKDGVARISYSDGVWRHYIGGEPVDATDTIAALQVPAEQARWIAAVSSYLEVVKAFGIDVFSSPIWDLEGAGCLDDPDVAVCTSLHTTYGLSVQYQPTWLTRPLFRRAVVERMIAAEEAVLAASPWILANSQAIIDDLEGDTGLEIRSRAAIAAHGVEISLPAPTPRGARETIRVLFVGRFEHRKGVDIAVESVLAASRRGVRLEAVFVGGEASWLDGAEPARLEDQPAIDRIEFRGRVSREELDECYRSADVVLAPSRYESFGQVVIEAMMHGCVVLGLDVGGPAEIIEHRKNGYLAPLDDDCVEHIAGFLGDLDADRDVLRSVGEAARATAVEKYSLAAMAAQVEQAFLGFLAARGSDR